MGNRELLILERSKFVHVCVVGMMCRGSEPWQDKQNLHYRFFYRGALSDDIEIGSEYSLFQVRTSTN